MFPINININILCIYIGFELMINELYVKVCIYLQWVMNAVDGQLFAAVGESFNSLRAQFWNTMDEEISLQDCVIYRYTWGRGGGCTCSHI